MKPNHDPAALYTQRRMGIAESTRKTTVI